MQFLLFVFSRGLCGNKPMYSLSCI